MTTVAEALAALDRVRDPELDESLAELGFVTAVDVDGDDVVVRLRLPTYFCAPNFAFLMVADARAAVEALPGVRRARIVLEDHFTAGEINAAVDRDAGFADAFGEQASGELDDLRTLFRRKALMARQGRICRGVPEPAIARMRLGDLEGDDADRCRQLRRELGIDASPDAAAFVTAAGAAVTAEDVPRFVRLTRLTSTSLEGNAGLCRSLLRTRYDLEVA